MSDDRVVPDAAVEAALAAIEDEGEVDYPVMEIALEAALPYLFLMERGSVSPFERGAGSALSDQGEGAHDTPTGRTPGPDSQPATTEDGTPPPPERGAWIGESAVTGTEFHVLGALWDGKTHAEIAAKFNVTEARIHQYDEDAQRKLASAWLEVVAPARKGPTPHRKARR